MTNKELIEYLLNFDMDAEVFFNDGTGKLFSITNDDKDLYLGDGKYDRSAKKVKLMTGMGNCKPVINDRTPDFIFQEGDYVEVTIPYYRKTKGIVTMESKGNIYVRDKKTGVSDKFIWYDLKKITREEYYGEN